MSLAQLLLSQLHLGRSAERVNVEIGNRGSPSDIILAQLKRTLAREDGRARFDVVNVHDWYDVNCLNVSPAAPSHHLA